MGVDKGKKLSQSKLKTHSLNKGQKVDKQTRIKQDKERKRNEKKAKHRQKFTDEDEMYNHEQDEEGYFKVPNDVVSI